MLRQVTGCVLPANPLSSQDTCSASDLCSFCSDDKQRGEELGASWRGGKVDGHHHQDGYGASQARHQGWGCGETHLWTSAAFHRNRKGPPLQFWGVLKLENLLLCCCIPMTTDFTPKKQKWSLSYIQPHNLATMRKCLVYLF